MQVRYRYRIYPAPGQQQALARAFGCARVVYNDCLRLRDACHVAGEKISDTEVQRRAVTRAKATTERAWLSEVASVALVQACQDARRAYKIALRLVRDNQAVYAEDLAVSGLMRTKLARSVADGLVSADALRGGESHPVRPHVRQDRPVRAHQPGVLGLRGKGRPEAAQRPGVGVRGVRDGPRP